MKKQSALFVLLLLVAFATVVNAQSTSDTLKVNPGPKQFRKIVGLNLSPLVTQLIPFNRSDPKEAGPYLLRFKAYGPKGKSAFRFSMGIHIIPDGDDNVDDPQLNLAFGWEKRRSISRRWSYTKGFDFMILAGDLNIPGNKSGEDFVAFAAGPVWGIEYFIERRISVGVEAALVLGFSPSSGTVVFDILPPVGLFLNHYF